MIGKERITRHVCPRNCYDTCAILASVKNGKIVNISGDPLHGYTKGKLCAKGYSYIRRVYSRDRIKYPLRQVGRGTGRWRRISWDEALEMICAQILKLKDSYGSTLPLCLNKYSGNFGLLNFAMEGLFNSLGPTTQVLGSPCWSAGLDAQHLDFGNNYNSDPENIEKAKLIILWGVNPVYTAVHSLPYIYQAQEQGAKVIVIDPIYSATAKKADWYIQIRPGQDGRLALALAKIIVENGKEDPEFLTGYSLGWQQYVDYLQSIDVRKTAGECGIKLDVINELAGLLMNFFPTFIWIGFGLQRYKNGGQNVRAIDALGALTGNLGKAGGGVHFANLRTWKLFNYNFLKTTFQNRYLNINQFAGELLETKAPPVKMLWISNRNLFRQDANINKLVKAIKNIDLIVTAEQFMTDSVHYSDIVLPTTTFFEEMDIVPSYWHHWIALNEQAIPPCHEAKSDLEIAALISQKLNELRPGISSFPEKKSEEYFLDQEFNPETYSLLGINHWSALKEAPVRANIPAIAWQDYKFETPSKKYEFYSEKAEKAGCPALPITINALMPDKKYPFRLLSPHSQHSLNSQFVNIDWIMSLKQEPVVFINSKSAKAKNIPTGSMVRIFNENGEISIKAMLVENIPPDLLICHQGIGNTTINKLLKEELTDMGSITTGAGGLAINETFVNIEPFSGEGNLY